jgi:DNA-binding beta-propeller fold protein YncE
MRCCAPWLAALFAGLLAGCASTDNVRGTMHYGMGDAPEGQRLLWPAAPEVPRFLYAGTLTGEANFRREAATGLRALGRWLAGADSDKPVVLQRPAAVIGDEAGRLYVSDTSRQAVYVFDGTAGELQVWEDAGELLHFASPAGLALAPQGGLFVADADLGVVVRLDSQGRPQQRIGRGVLNRPVGVARDAATGRLFVADTYAHDIKVFDDAGSLLHTIGRRGSGEGEFNYPTHLAFAGGELYVTDTMNSRVQVFDASGAVQRRFGQRGLYLGNLVRPKGVSVDAEGNVYVVESYHDSLLVFSPRGEFLLPIGGTGTSTGRFYLPSGVWVDTRNRVHVADMFNGRIVLFQFLGGG